LDVSLLRKMYSSGMDAVRINTVHGDIDQYESIIKTVRMIADIPIIMDVKGPDLRVSLINDLLVEKGTRIWVGFSKKEMVSFTGDCYKDVKIGDWIHFEDGILESKVIKKQRHKICIEFIKKGILKDKKNVSVIGRRLTIPSLTKNDLVCIMLAKRLKIDYIALSYTRDAEDILNLRKLIGKSDIGIIAKIENPDGLKSIDPIIEAAQGVMVARGSLGVELPLQKVPMIQKSIIKKCIAKGKLVITATQMLESMINNHRPTRAEASDVANAILDGSDAIMLSGETAIGKYPVKTVEVMASIAKEVELNVGCQLCNESSSDLSDAITNSVYSLCQKTHIDHILILTKTGHTARMMSRFRSGKMLIAVTPDQNVKRKLHLFFGVFPVFFKAPVLDMGLHAILYCYHEKILSKRDIVVCTGGMYTEKPMMSNLIHVQKVSDLIRYKDN